MKASLALICWSYGPSPGMVQARCHIKDDPNTHVWEEKGPVHVEIGVLHFVVTLWKWN